MACKYHMVAKFTHERGKYLTGGELLVSVLFIMRLNEVKNLGCRKIIFYF